MGEEGVAVQHLSSADSTHEKPKRKKLKTNQDGDKDFYATCKYYAELPPPEYAYSVKATDERKYSVLESNYSDNEQQD